MESTIAQPWLQHLATLGVAMAAGLLVGLERERAAARDDHPHFAGVRTLALFGLVGGLGGLLSTVLGPWVAVALVLAVVIVSVAGGRQDDAAGGAAGVTTEAATLLVLSLGLLSTTPLPGLQLQERLSLVGAVTLVGTTLLTLRGPLHRFAGSISREEMLQTTQLGLLMLVVLPLLPDIELWGIGGLNPREVGWMVALIACIGFAGYVGVRLLGSRRGMALAGLLGGLVSSTAVTLGLSGRVATSPDLAQVAGRGIVLACVMMVPRQLLELIVVAPERWLTVARPLLAMTAVGVAGAALSWKQASGASSPDADRLRNPGSLGEALKFGLLYLVVIIVSDRALVWLGPGGLYASAVLAGLTDVDAITLMVGRRVAADLPPVVGSVAITLAACTNTIVKVSIAAVVGGRRLGTTVAIGLLPMVVVGLVVAFLFTG